MSIPPDSFYAGLAEKLDEEGPETIDVPDKNFSARAVKEPLGVVAAISPWNFPLLMVAQKMAAALGAGCTFVV